MSRERCTIRRAIESLTACIYTYTGSFIIVSIQLTTIFPATKGRRGDEYEVSRDCQKADYTKGHDGCVRTCMCTCVPFERAHIYIHTYIHTRARGDRTHATISYSHRAVSLRSVLRRRDDKGAGNSLFILGTMSVHRRLGLIPNETSLYYT